MSEIYYRPTCRYSMKALKILDDNKIVYKSYNINENPNLRDEMIEKSGGAFTVPQIFINGVHIGGWIDLVNFNKKY